MILIFGTRLARHAVGYVAEVCPRCSAIRQCRLRELSQGTHFFYIPVGRGKVPLGHEAECGFCRHRFEVPAILYHEILRRRKAGLDELAARTSPWLAGLSEPERAGEERTRRILGILMRYEGTWREREMRGGVQLDWVSGIGLLLATIVPIGLIGLNMAGGLPFLTKVQMMSVTAIGAMISAVIGIQLISNEGERFFRRRLQPEMASGLAGAGAIRSEVETAVQRMKRLRFPFWRLLARYAKSMKEVDLMPLRNIPPNAPVAAAPVWQPPGTPLIRN